MLLVQVRQAGFQSIYLNSYFNFWEIVDFSETFIYDEDVNFNDLEPIDEIKPVLTEDYKIPEPIETKTVSIPYEIKTKETIITNVNTDTSKYTEKETPKGYYSEITIEDINKAVEVIEKNTAKPKKRRL